MIFSVLREASQRGELLTHNAGLCRFHKLRDGSVTIHEIVIHPHLQRRGYGRLLVQMAIGEARVCVARCPDGLPANGFWQHLGFELIDTQKTRAGNTVNVWRWEKLCD
jgi:ribosomal protein S18 acetylase RimI-like enzyme